MTAHLKLLVVGHWLTMNICSCSFFSASSRVVIDVYCCVLDVFSGDFYASEQSVIMDSDTAVEIVLTDTNGTETVLKESVKLLKGEVVDSSFMSAKALEEFYEAECQDAKENELLLSLHLKATMMKVSDPILFGHCIRVYFKAAFDKHGATLEEIGANPNRGLASVYEVVKEKAPNADEIIQDFEACYEGEDRPWLAMVDSDRGITNLHAPNDIIIDASMPVVVRGTRTTNAVVVVVVVFNGGGSICLL